MFRARIPVHPGEINAAGCPQGSDAPTVEITGPDAGQHKYLTRSRPRDRNGRPGGRPALIGPPTCQPDPRSARRVGKENHVSEAIDEIGRAHV